MRRTLILLVIIRNLLSLIITLSHSLLVLLLLMTDSIKMWKMVRQKMCYPLLWLLGWGHGWTQEHSMWPDHWVTKSTTWCGLDQLGCVDIATTKPGEKAQTSSKSQTSVGQYQTMLHELVLRQAKQIIELQRQKNNNGCIT